MIASEVIRKKRDGLELSDEEISFFVEGAAKAKLPDYQLSAFLMSIYFRGLSARETYSLTLAMKNSGHSYHWKKLQPKLADYPLIDKHSTGGVGDKVSLVLVPLAISLGLRVPMMSGRGLGHTGGTVDKLCSISGLRMDFSQEEAAKIIAKVGGVFLAQSDELCPADKKLYQLRDVTATIESLPLITASIISKKWAEGCEGIVFDVKFGEGAFMGTPEQAEELADWLLRVSQLAKLKAEAVLSRMEEPLGSCIGNALEIKESLWILKNEYPTEQHREVAKPLKKLCCQIATRMAMLGGLRSDFEMGILECEKILNSGKAYQKFDEMVRAQGAAEDWESKLPAHQGVEILSPSDGTVSDIEARNLGILGLDFGVGRKRADDEIDSAAGMEILVAPGSKVKKGDLIGYLYLKDPDSRYIESILNCIKIDDQQSVKSAGALLWKILSQKSA